MQFSTVVTCDRNASNKSDIINELQKSINSYVNTNNYGNDIMDYFINFDITNYPDGYEHLQKKFKPKYTEHRVSVNRYTGEKMEIIKQFHYSIIIGGDLYNMFINGTREESMKIIATEIFKSFSNLDKLPKKVTDFEKEKFKSDMRFFFKCKNLL